MSVKHHFGRRKPCNKPALKFGKYFRAAMPVFPVVNYLSKIDWSGTMNGNDREGDCVSCMVVNDVNLTSTYLAPQRIVASLTDVINFYKTQNPKFDPNSKTHGPGSNDDGGMDIQLALEHLVKSGIQINGNTYWASGFVKLDHTSLPQMRAAISLFGSILLGVNVTDAQQTQFSKGQAWDYVKNSPIEGGHAILGGGHMDQAKNDLQAVCWAAPFAITDTFVSHLFEEAWAVIWPWHLQSKEFVSGMDLATFAKDFTDITGEPWGFTPVPAPSPTPTPVDADKTLWAQVQAWASSKGLS